jgi:hypothetical protein
MKRFGFEPFDIVIFALQAILVLPDIGVGRWLSGPIPSFVVAVLFFLGLYLKRYDPAYVQGVKKLCQSGSIIPGIILFGGTLICGILMARHLIGGGLDVLSLVTGVPKKILFSHWLTIIFLLPIIFTFPFYMFYLFSWAHNNPETFLKSRTVNRPLRFLSRLGIMLQATILMEYIYQTFEPNVGQPDLFLSVIGALFLTGLFYLPIRVHEFFLQPDGPHWQSYFQTVLAIVCYQHSVYWGVFLLV